MSIQLNHTIVWCNDRPMSASFLADILGLPEPKPFGPFLVVELSNGVSLDFKEKASPIASQHYAFLVGEDDFDHVHDRITAHGIEYWADPGKQLPGKINHGDGGRGMYFEDPNGHLLEVITRPYGSSSA